MNNANYHFSLGHHRNARVIWIRFSYDPELIEALRVKFPFVKWSQSQKAWYLPNVAEIRKQLQIENPELYENSLPMIHPVIPLLPTKIKTF